MLEKMKIEKGDHTSKYMTVNGYPVTVRFSSEPSPEIYAQLKSVLLSSISVDNLGDVCDDVASVPPNCTLKTEKPTKPHYDESEEK